MAPRPSQRVPGILAIRDFRILLAGTALVAMVSPLQVVTQVFWAQERFPDDSVRIATLIAGSRGAAMVLFSFWGGAIADRFERRRVLLATESTSVVLHAIVAAFMITVPFGVWTVAPVAAFTFFGAGVQSVDLPARQASIPAIVGVDRLSRAISLNALAIQLTIGVSLPLTGLLNSIAAPGVAYACSLFSWLAILPLIAALRFRSTGTAGGSVLRNVADGVRYSTRNPVIFGVVTMMLAAMVIGMPAITIPFGPIWITDVLGRSEGEFGFIAATWGLGAILGAALVTRVSGLTDRGVTLFGALFFFGVAIVIFGSVRIVPGAVVGNLIHGLSFAVLNATAATIVQHTASDAMRGRVMSLFPLMQGVSQLSIVFYGELAEQEVVSLVVLVPAMGWATLGVGVLLAVAFPALRRARTGAMAPGV